MATLPDFCGRAVPGPILDVVMTATSDRGLETAPTRRLLPPGTADMLVGGRAVLGPILDVVVMATSDRGLETAPTGRPLLPGWAGVRIGGRAVLGPILDVVVIATSDRGLETAHQEVAPSRRHPSGASLAILVVMPDAQNDHRLRVNRVTHHVVPEHRVPDDIRLGCLDDTSPEVRKPAEMFDAGNEIGGNTGSRRRILLGNEAT